MDIKNPWTTLALNQQRQNFILDEERSIIAKFNARVSDQYKIHTSIFSAPFMGDINHARVIILMLNPGYDPKEEQAGYYSIYKDWWLKQIQHIHPCPELPLFCLEKEYAKKSPYWSNKLKPVTEICRKRNSCKKTSKDSIFPLSLTKIQTSLQKAFKRRRLWFTST